TLGVRDDGERAMESRQVEGLRRPEERDRAVGHLWTERGHGNVLMAVEQDVAVDFVRQDEDPARQTELREPLELLPSIHSTQRIVWIAQDERAGRARQRTLEVVAVDGIAAVRRSTQFGGARIQVRVSRDPQEGWINRTLNDNPG